MLVGGFTSEMSQDSAHESVRSLPNDYADANFDAITSAAGSCSKSIGVSFLDLTFRVLVNYLAPSSPRSVLPSAPISNRGFKHAERITQVNRTQALGNDLLASLAASAKSYAQTATALVALTAGDEETTIKLGNTRQISDIGCDEVAVLLNISPTSARNQVHEARLLVRDLTEVHETLAAAKITVPAARALVEGWRTVVNARSLEFADLQVRAQIASYYQSRLLIRAQNSTLLNLRKAIRLLVARLISKEAQSSHEAAKFERQVSLNPTSDGMTWLNALLTNAEAAAIDQALEALARANTTDTTIAQKRADEFVGLLTGTSDLADESLRGLAQIQVVVGIDTLLELNDDAALITCAQTTLTAQAIRELAAENPLRRLVAQPVSGELIECGRNTYAPTNALRRKVSARDQHCRAPGCSRPARYCDIDHIEPWREGGQTNENNLATLCRRHHVLKTAKGHNYRMNADATVTWKLPSGQEFVTQPADYSLFFSDPPPF